MKKYVGAQLPESVKYHFYQIASEEGRSAASIIRYLIMNYIKNYESEENEDDTWVREEISDEAYNYVIGDE